MQTERHVRTLTVTVKHCERCNGSHDFPIEVVVDRVVGVVAFQTERTEICDVVLSCPKTSKDIVVSVPVSLEALETLVRAQPKR